MEKVIEYFKGVKAEWGKITWPERKQVMVQTCVVIVIVTVFTMITYGLDVIYKGIISALKLTA